MTTEKTLDDLQTELNLAELRIEWLMVQLEHIEVENESLRRENARLLQQVQDMRQ